MDLRGLRILVTRPAGQAGDMVRSIEAHGGIAVCAPMIRIVPPVQWDECDAHAGRLREFAGIVFSSANGVEFFLNRLGGTGSDRAQLATTPVYAVGRKTARALEHAGIAPAFVPASFSGAGLAAHFRTQDLRGQRYLLPRGDSGREEIADALGLAGAVVVQVIVYRTIGPDEASAAVVRAALAGRSIDIVTFASPSAVRHFAALLDGDLRRRIAGDLVVGVIGETTAEAAREFSFPADVVAGAATAEGLIDALVSWNPAVQQSAKNIL